MIKVPAYFFSVDYNSACYPGAPGAAGLSNGANCQHFASELLRHFGKIIPNFRSSELWEDAVHTRVVLAAEAFEPFDLMLYHARPTAWGAHVGVFLGDNAILHLAKHIGRPVIWCHEDFLETARYRYFIGAKRPGKA